VLPSGRQHSSDEAAENDPARHDAAHSHPTVRKSLTRGWAARGRWNGDRRQAWQRSTNHQHSLIRLGLGTPCDDGARSALDQDSARGLTRRTKNWPGRCGSGSRSSPECLPRSRAAAATGPAGNRDHRTLPRCLGRFTDQVLARRGHAAAERPDRCCRRLSVLVREPPPVGEARAFQNTNRPGRGHRCWPRGEGGHVCADNVRQVCGISDELAPFGQVKVQSLDHQPVSQRLPRIVQ
jgi:hypothetical protein